MSLTALQSGVLNSLNRFTAAAAAPILLNLALIGSNLVALALGTGNTPATGHILAWGIFGRRALAVHAAGGGVPAGRHAAGAALAAPDAGREAGHPAVGPGDRAGGIMQINLLVGTIDRHRLRSARCSYLYYADRLYQLPLGVIGIAIGIVLLPTSRPLGRRRRAGRRDQQNRAIEIRCC